MLALQAALPCSREIRTWLGKQQMRGHAKSLYLSQFRFPTRVSQRLPKLGGVGMEEEKWEPSVAPHTLSTFYSAQLVYSYSVPDQSPSNLALLDHPSVSPITWQEHRMLPKPCMF